MNSATHVIASLCIKVLWTMLVTRGQASVTSKPAVIHPHQLRKKTQRVTVRSMPLSALHRFRC